MSAVGTVLFCLLASLLVMTALWAISLAISDSSIVDIWWGAGFVVLTWTAIALKGSGSDARWAAAAMVTVWGLRLTIHLARRNIGKGEDPRYTAMRSKAGKAWPLRSLFVVFWLQGLIMWIVALPALVAVVSSSSPELPVLVAGIVLWGVGMFFETVGDMQLDRFKADPESKGKVMDSGLWRYTRHPNYFGDACVWWGIWLAALSVGAWWTAIGPALINFMLVRVSGKAMLERSIGKRRPGYDEYIRRTSGFFPRPPLRD
jgi:steroid 5-alpha reductase family enzyme